ATSPQVQPGATATFEVSVRHDDQPVAGAEVALMVVDEAVLALSDRHHEDPLPAFYAPVLADASSVSTGDFVDDAGAALDGEPGFVRSEIAGGFGRGSYGVGEGGGGSGYGVGMGRGGLGVVTARKDFRANAAFSPRLHTGPDGKVRLDVKMPDSLTRFRVI